MSENLILNKDAYAYLVNQQGQFNHLKDRPDEFAQAYHEEVQKTVDQIAYSICEPPRNVLDIGCGLGVIDMILMRAKGTHCVLIDGEDGDGNAKRYDVPFGNRKIVERFMADNEVPRDLWSYRNPQQLDNCPVFDLVLSLRSWCFHYPPEAYLSFVQRHVVPTTRIIIDVRRKRDWRDRLNAVWNNNYVLEQSVKHERMLYVVGGRVQ